MWLVLQQPDLEARGNHRTLEQQPNGLPLVMLAGTVAMGEGELFQENSPQSGVIYWNARVFSNAGGLGSSTASDASMSITALDFWYLDVRFELL